ncbi:EF-hand calcium-binding domain-containing protein 7-like [Portunus trituberculatus]|uniref:EF-hand calcium-binding domain-containing protein 7-like n=1 Tax=Portunus trituberculatus TaxID=210409 RepID=UPI001E1CDD33|nr:EF-hand calcium-binding domain-containing protein 7-like [Portunus trituberculatus]
MDIEESRQKELLAAYLCVKPSVAEDLCSAEEVKRALQYAGLSPTPAFLAQHWQEDTTESVTFEHFCGLAEQLPDISIDDIEALFMKVFGTADGKVEEDDFKRLVGGDEPERELSDADLNYILQEANVVSSGSVDCSKLCKVILHTVNEMKQLSVQRLEERSHYQRINSKTFTRKKREKFANQDASSGTGQSTLDLEGWNEADLKGCFYLDKGSILAHQYSMEVSCLGPTVVRMKPKSYMKQEAGRGPVDTLSYIFRESHEGMRNYIGYTDQRDSDGSYFWRDTLKEGRYVVIPYTSGCRLRERLQESEATIELVERQSKVQLTPEFRLVLEEIFDQVDLDSNGRLSREEFNLYNWRTSGEEVQDDEWAVVQANFDVQDGELTLNGFLALHQLEAEDNGGDSEDLWVSLDAMGYNRAGRQDQAAPFTLSVFSQVCQPTLQVSGLKSGGLLLDKAVVRSIMENADPVKIKNMIDLIKYEYVGDHRASVVVQNKAHSKVTVRVDCSQSLNVITNRPSLDWTVEVAGKSAIIAHQLLPSRMGENWTVVCDTAGDNLSEEEE